MGRRRSGPVTLYDICERTGFSSATVSRVINQSPKVGAATRDRVLKAILKTGYVPSQAARTLARRQTQALGVVFPDIDSGFFSEVLRGIDEVAAQHDYHLMTAFSHGRRDEEGLIERFVREGRVDALIVMNLKTPDAAIARAAKLGTPIVLLDQPVAGSGLFTAMVDNVGGAEAAVAHLLAHGHRRIVLLDGPEDNFDAHRRLIGAKRSLAQAGVELSAEFHWRGRFTEASGRALMEAWLDAGQPLPDAIFAFNDLMALGALDVLGRRGMGAPRDVAMIGFDDIDSARHAGLTTVTVPMRQMGREAADAAIRLISGGRLPTRRVLPTRLSIRRSCGCGQNGLNSNMV